MADARFFKQNGPFTLAQILGTARMGAVECAADRAEMVYGLDPLDAAGPQDLSFFDNVKYKEQFTASRSGFCFAHPKMAPFAPAGMIVLGTTAPYKAYALAAQMFFPEIFPPPAIHSGAHIDLGASIGPGCVIEAGVVIGPGAEIGEKCWLEAGCVIGAGVVLGPACRIGPCASVSHALIGAHVRLYPGVRVGQDGFGFAIDPAGHVKVPQLGRVIIEDGVEIGANTTIDRGAGPDTVIGAGTWIDNLVQIGHNVKIGKGCIIVAQAGISGSTVLEDFVAVGGQAGLTGHLHIGRGARIAGQSGVMRDVPTGEDHMGSPAMPIKQHLRQVAALERLARGSKKS